jgi:hypothetical protein
MLAFDGRLPVAALEAVPANLAPPFALSLSKREAWRLRRNTVTQPDFFLLSEPA